MNWWDWFGVIALILVVIMAFYVLQLRGDLEDLRRKIVSLMANDEATYDEPKQEAEGLGAVVVIYNPSKVVDYNELKKVLAEAAGDAGLPEPVWLATSVEDPGAGQTRQAIAMKPSVVIAAGGDGTVRQVAGELAGAPGFRSDSSRSARVICSLVTLPYRWVCVILLLLR